MSYAERLKLGLAPLAYRGLRTRIDATYYKTMLYQCTIIWISQIELRAHVTDCSAPWAGPENEDFTRHASGSDEEEEGEEEDSEEAFSDGIAGVDEDGDAKMTGVTENMFTLLPRSAIIANGIIYNILNLHHSEPRSPWAKASATIYCFGVGQK